MLARVFVADVKQLLVGVEAEHLELLHRRRQVEVDMPGGNELRQITFPAQGGGPHEDIEDTGKRVFFGNRVEALAQQTPAGCAAFMLPSRKWW